MYYSSHTDFLSTEPPTTNNPNGQNHGKICFKAGRNRIKKKRFCKDLYRLISARVSISIYSFHLPLNHPRSFLMKLYM